MSFKNRTVFGDFQTPPGLASQVVRLLVGLGVAPASIVEPSCGRGHLLLAAREQFGEARYLGVEINPTYLRACRRKFAGPGLTLVGADFFATDWDALLAGTAEPMLVLGNPPWVTTAGLTAAAGTNAPKKTSDGLVGLDAVTGRANFDISEWMLRHLIERIDGRDATLAMLCKTSVARKLLGTMWKQGRGPRDARMYIVDALASFGAAVDACLLVCRFPAAADNQTCSVYPSLSATRPAAVIGFRDGALVADMPSYERTKGLLTGGERWRSGVKHDCSPVVELTAEGHRYRNGLGELVDLEPELLFPMLKSSGLAKGAAPQRFMLVTQRHTSDPTERIERAAPKTWRYLQSHRERFARRASSIYRKRSAFAMFGIGDYTFTPWKVAVSGFYKQIKFRAIGPWDNRPVVFDDTCYFLPCADRAEAERRAAGLNSETARDFFRAHVFSDNKRPVTARLLSRLDVDALSG